MQKNKAPKSTFADDFEIVLKQLLHSTAGSVEEDFLQRIAAEICRVLGLEAMIIAEINPFDPSKLTTAVVVEDQLVLKNFDFSVKGSVCERVLRDREVVIEQDLKVTFPEHPKLSLNSAKSCISVPLEDSRRKIFGAIVGLSNRSLNSVALASSVLEVFSFRIAAELERQKINSVLRHEVVINQTQLDSVPALMFMVTKDGQLLRWNQYFCSRFGYSDDKLKNANMFNMIDATDRQRVKLELQAIIESGSGTLFVNGITVKGHNVPLLATAESTIYKGQPVIVGVAMDMTEQQNTERNLLRSQGRLARKNSQLSLINTLVEKLHTSHSMRHIAEDVVAVLHDIQISSSIGFYVLKDEKFLEMAASSNISRRFLAARGRVSIEHKGTPTGIALESRRLELFPDVCNDERLDKAIRETFKSEGIWGIVVLPLIYKQEVLGSISIGFKPDVEIPDDELDFYQTIGSSIALALSNARQYQRLENLATRDPLTELPNRNAFNQDCFNLINQSKNNDDLVGVILVDLDRFKEINDTLDHQIGDKLLQLIGPRLVNALKDKFTQVYRLGGDEFGLLIAGKREETAINFIAKKVEKLIAEPFIVDGLNLEIASSIGVVVSDGKNQTAAEMLRCAELAMYAVKNRGGGTLVYSPALDADTNQRYVIMAEMAEAIRNDDLVLHFQPKLDLKTKRIIGSEALVRWKHKKYGLLPPAKFIPQVELTQLINPLTYWVLKNAIIQLQAWKAQGIDVSMAINLSTRNLTDEDFIAEIDRLIEEYQVDPKQLEFEVTETALMNNLEQAKGSLNKFSQRGIQCALDDYGTGYSSLTYIKKLPLDILKIDRAFISRMLEDKDDHIIAKSTINLAHSLGLKVIAEGVEDERTLNALAEQGCDFIQGYHISEPVDGDSFAKLYWEQN